MTIRVTHLLTFFACLLLVGVIVNVAFFIRDGAGVSLLAAGVCALAFFGNAWAYEQVRSYEFERDRDFVRDSLMGIDRKRGRR